MTSIEARSPLFAVATANGGKMICTFEPSDVRILTFPLFRSTSVTSPLMTWCTAPAAATLADGVPDDTTTGVPVVDGSVVTVVPGVVCLAHPVVATRRTAAPRTKYDFMLASSRHSSSSDEPARRSVGSFHKKYSAAVARQGRVGPLGLRGATPRPVTLCDTHWRLLGSFNCTPWT